MDEERKQKELEEQKIEAEYIADAKKKGMDIKKDEFDDPESDQEEDKEDDIDP